MNVAFCNIAGMNASPSLAKQLRGIGISQPYASQIARGKRAPGLQTAIRIFRELGVKLGPIAKASKTEIDALERVGAKRT